MLGSRPAEQGLERISSLLCLTAITQISLEIIGTIYYKATKVYVYGLILKGRTGVQVFGRHSPKSNTLILVCEGMCTETLFVCL